MPAGVSSAAVTPPRLAAVRGGAPAPAGPRYAGLAGLAGPVVPGEELLPVLPALAGLLPAGGLPRGQVITAGLAGDARGTAGLLLLAMAAGASAAGAWCAAAGLPALGVRAAAGLGLDTERLLLVADPGRNWPPVAASLLDGCDIVLLRPPGRPPPAALRRRLEAAARRAGSVLLVAGEWEGAHARLRVARQEWAGLGAGHGRLRARLAQVTAQGRGAGARPRSAWLWLPGPDGRLQAADAPAAPAAGDAPMLAGIALAGAALAGTG